MRIPREAVEEITGEGVFRGGKAPFVRIAEDCSD